MKLPSNPVIPGASVELSRLLRDICNTVNDQVRTYGPISLNIGAQAGDYTLSPGDYTANYTSGSHTCTLPSAVQVGFGKVYNIKNTGTGIITVATTAAQTIDGHATISLNQYDNLQVQSDGTNWIIL